MAKLISLALQEEASHGGFTHMAVITADELTMATANTVQLIKIGSIPKGAIIHKMEIRLQVPFEDVSDAAFNTTTVIIGDIGSTNRFITSSELNRNGTEITIPVFTNTSYGPLAGDLSVYATFGSMAGKSLSNIDKGELHVFVQILDTKILSDLKGNAVIAK